MLGAILKWLIWVPIQIFGGLMIIGTIDQFVFGGARPPMDASDYVRLVVYLGIGVLFPIYTNTRDLINTYRARQADRAAASFYVD